MNTPEVTKIAVASKTDVKINATKYAAENPRFIKLLGGSVEVVGVKVASGVSDQPMTDEETMQGAKNRARRILEVVEDANIGAGLEGGLRKSPDGTYLITGFVYLLDRNGRDGFGEAATVAVPEDVMDLVMQGQELSKAVEAVYGTDTSNDRDCTGVITNGKLNATDYYTEAARLAFSDYLQISQTH